MQRRNRYTLERSPLFGLASRSRLASLLKLSNRQLRSLGSSKDILYSEFYIAKASGGSRQIENPARQLKTIQGLLARFLSRIEPSKHLFCPVKGRSYVGNASVHLSSSHIYCLDIHKFFPSVSSRRVFWFFNTIMCCAPDLAGLLTSLSTYKEHLPTGSPLSPILAYYCYSDMWEKISSLCALREYELSIYVDDITISSKTIVRTSDIWKLKEIIASYGLKYHKERNFKDKPALVTGCVIDGAKLLVPHRQFKKRRLLEKSLQAATDIKTTERIDRTIYGLVVQMRQISASNPTKSDTKALKTLKCSSPPASADISLEIATMQL